MSENPWRYFRSISDKFIRRVRSGEGKAFSPDGVADFSPEPLGWYVQVPNMYPEITEDQAVAILGGKRPWEEKKVELNPWRYFRRVGDNYVRRVREGDRGSVFYRSGGRIESGDLAWYLAQKDYTEITESEAIDILGGRPWEPAITLEPDPQPATPTADPSPPVPSSAFSVQIGGDHYKDLPIQPIEYCQRNGLGAVESFVVKYVTRWRTKGGVEDLRKAIHLLEMLIEMEAKHA